MSDSSITASCKVCGSDQFKFDQEKPDDQVSCGNCGAEVGTLTDIRAALIAEGKRVVNDSIADLKRKLRKSGWK